MIDFQDEIKRLKRIRDDIDLVYIEIEDDDPVKNPVGDALNAIEVAIRKLEEQSE